MIYVIDVCMFSTRVLNDEVPEIQEGHYTLTNRSIRDAVRLWHRDRAIATTAFGRIENWNTSRVTDLSYLFHNFKVFDDNISEWDVSNVKNMKQMFCGAFLFNQDLGGWDVSNVTDMSGMFWEASHFDHDLSRWNVSNVTDFDRMFCRASSFNQDVGAWDMSQATNISYMFYEASAFDQDVSGWDISSVKTLYQVFDYARLLQRRLKRACGVSSFFDMNHRHMSSESRQRVFSVALRWDRRKDFVMFLAMQCHLSYCNSGDCFEWEEMSCDVLFDVLDISREICKYL